MMTMLAFALTRGRAAEVTFGATVTSAPRFFYGTRTHAVHEAFAVRSDDGHALEVIDNVALAPRVPVLAGDRVTIRGELIPSAKPGPIVHWTHRDPAGRHCGGYIELRGRRYA